MVILINIDVNTLINALIHYQNVISVINQSYGQGSRSVKMQVNAIKQGSFVIDISIQETLSTFFSFDEISYLAGLVAITDGVIKAYKYFKGKPINEENKSSFSIHKDTVITKQIINVYNQPVIREAISKSIETAKNDDNVDGLTISFDSEKDTDKSTSFSREEFNDYIYTDFDTESQLPEEKVNEEEAILIITSLSFENKNKWRFIYNGFRISVCVKDDALIESIEKGELFGKGDSLRVKLRIVQRYDEEYHTYVNSSYHIMEVYEHIRASSQSSIDF